MGRATPIRKRTSHVEIHVAATEVAAKPAPAAAAAQAPARPKAKAAGKKPVDKKATAGKATKPARRKGSK